MNKLSVNMLDIIIVITAGIYSLSFEINSRKIIAGSVAIVALIFWIMARYQLGKAFSVKPKVNFLVTNGIYKKIRHPIYIFSSVAALATTIMFNIWWMYVLIGLLIIVQFRRAHLEERLLLNKFPNEYSEYKKNTWI